MLDINPYIIALPYFTVIPVNWLFEYLIITPPNLAQKHKWLRIKRCFGMGLGVIFALGAILSIYILAANKSEEQNLAWKYDFCFTISQDVILVPLITIMVQYLIFSIAVTKGNKLGTEGFKGFLARKVLMKELVKPFSK